MTGEAGTISLLSLQISRANQLRRCLKANCSNSRYCQICRIPPSNDPGQESITRRAATFGGANSFGLVADRSPICESPPFANRQKLPIAGTVSAVRSIAWIAGRFRSHETIGFDGFADNSRAPWTTVRFLTQEKVAMLVLSRKTDERIKIGDIEVVVLEIQGNKVRLGINAPREISVVRTELIQSGLSAATRPAT